MKHHHRGNARAAARAEASLYRAILSLETEAECRRFFADLCTPAELEALVDRWSVVAYLEDGVPYRRIHELTGVSVTTIGRVARFLSNGNGGYRTALERTRPAASPNSGRQEHAD
ncbi:MAG TPA: YerC/YecD family TrpR-related protein [Gammaproteobacteria bacterium]